MNAKQMFDRIFFSRKFDHWAEEQTLVSARILNQAAADILRRVEIEIGEAGWRDAYDSGRFLRDKVAPTTREVTEPLAILLIEEANQTLAELVDLKLHWTRRLDVEPMQNGIFEGTGDIAAAVLPLGVGAASAVALPFIAVSTTVVMFGFATVTTISWPIVAAGSAVAALGVATGAIQTSKLWSKAEARLRRKSREFVVATLLEGQGDQPALLECLEGEFLEAAHKAKAL